MKKRIVSVLLISTVLIGCFCVTSFGASKNKKMTVYDEVIVRGNYAYCSAGKGLYKVNLKTSKVKKMTGVVYRDVSICFAMKYHKGYIYYKEELSMGGPLYRVKTTPDKNGKYKKKCIGGGCAYVISNGRIYYNYVDTNKNGDTIFRYKSSKLNGKNNRKSPFKVSNKYMRSNKRGYKIENVEFYDCYKYYLCRPNSDDIFICKENKD